MILKELGHVTLRSPKLYLSEIPISSAISLPAEGVSHATYPVPWQCETIPAPLPTRVQDIDRPGHSVQSDHRQDGTTPNALAWRTPASSLLAGVLGLYQSENIEFRGACAPCHGIWAPATSPEVARQHRPRISCGYSASAMSRSVAITSMRWPGWWVTATRYGLQSPRPVHNQRRCNTAFVLILLVKSEWRIAHLSPTRVVCPIRFGIPWFLVPTARTFKGATTVIAAE